MGHLLTNPQNSIWLTEKFFKGTSVNNISGYTYISENVDFEILKKAINEVIKANDAMRIKIKEEHNSCIQYISEYVPFDMDLIELPLKDYIQKKSLELAKIPFVIENNLLFKFILFKLPDNSGGFFLTAHHIIGDSWGLALLVKEVINNYSEIKNNSYVSKTYPSYTSFINTEKEYLKSEKFIKDKEYWDSVFKSIPEIASIPSMKNKKNIIHSCNGAREKFIVPEKEISKIKEFCANNKISVYNFFMAVYSLYLGRVSNLDDFVVGTPILNRTNFEQKHTMGMFISTAPLRINLDHELSFIDFSKNIASNSMSLLRHQKYPYQAILEDLRKKGNNIPNLYNVVLSYQISKTFDEESGIKYSAEWLSNGCCADELQVHLFDLNDESTMTIAYDYKTDKYEAQDIRDLHNRILTVINQVISHHEILLKNIEIVTPEEKHKILYEFNDTAVDYPRDKTIVDLFEEQVEKTPNNIAVVFEDQKLTYKELNEKANQLARYLIQNGIKNKDVVGLRMDKSLEMIIGIIAIIKAGCCYLPFNMAYPEDRVNYMLEDSNCKILLTLSNADDIKYSTKNLNIDLNNNSIYQGDTDNINIKISPEDLIYIIYTSGSTGKPKGAMLCHKNVVRLMKNDKYLFNFSENDVWTMFHSVAFDFSVWEMYGALLYGGKLIMVTDEVAKNPKLFLDLLRKEQVTILNQTPSYFYNLQDVELSLDNSDLNLRYIIYGGEALNPLLVRPWKQKYNFTKLINMYGITETTVHVTFKELSNEDLNSSSSLIGKPIPTLKVYVLDKNLNLQPYNAIGQLCVAGDGVCVGYLNRPDLNSTKFIDNPFNSSEKIYLSGDNGFLSRSGNLYYNGRIDNQFKLRGFRIELDEIESKILSNPCISKCIVLPKKVDNKDTQLIAYIVCNKDIAISELKNYIYNLLPTYMIPSHFVKLKSIPLTPNGKADRKKLLSIDIVLDNSTPYVAPRNNFEEDFISIVENSLNISGIGIDHNLLDIGTDSLTLMKISVELLNKSYIINIQDIYEYKTIRNISENLNNLHNSNNVENLESITLDFDETFMSNNTIAKNVLLTGATGFLGSHLLYDIIKNSSANVYCLVRNRNNKTGKERLIKKLNYYFKNELDEYIDSRINVVEGDITFNKFGLSDNDYNYLKDNLDTVIHSAALVSHYGSSSVFKKMNVQGTSNVVDFCINNNLKLNYISTISVSGESVDSISNTVTFDEHCLYVGQNYSDNIYIKTKFDAEKLVIDAINDKKLKATIYRIGNITARYNDFKFQENETDNAFLNRMKSLITLGAFPESYLDRLIDFSPVDFCSKIINKISFESNSDNKIFHIYNNNTIKVCEILNIFEEQGYKFKVLSNKDFIKFISTTASDKDKLGIINDITSQHLDAKNNIIIKSDFTKTFIEKLNISWPEITTDYILKFLKGD